MQLHGSFPYRECEEYGLNPDSIIDFSASVNPFPLPPEIVEAYKEADLRAYPDRSNVVFTQTLVDFYGLKDENLLPCAGTTELIYALPFLFKKPVILTPAYGDYKDAFGRHNISLIELTYENYTPGEKVEGDLFIIINPSNPEGHYFTPYTIEEICLANPNCRIVVDEAYQELGEHCESVLPLVDSCPNLTVFRSLTKSFAIAGIRAGFAYSETLTKLLKKYMTPWAVSTPIQKVLPLLYKNYAKFQEQWRTIGREKEKLKEGLDALNITVKSGRGPFLLFKVSNGPKTREQLLREHAINIRECSSFGLDNWIRVMPGTSENNKNLLKAIPVCL